MRTSFERECGVIPNVYLASSVGAAFDSYTLSLCPTYDTDDYSHEYLQKGVLMAKITSGGDTGKVGPYDPHATDGRQTAANIVGFNDTFVPLVDCEKEIGVLYTGTVDKDKVIVDGVQGDPGATVQGYCRTAGMDILFR